MNTTTLTSQYKAKGWAITTPLPTGKKYPPATGITGNVDHQKRLEAAETAWNNAEPGCNIGLIMATDNPEFDVIAIDVDHYGDKRGADNLAELEPQLGSLELSTVPRSTRRGADSRSAQYFVKVAKGYSWPTAVCEAVDIVQSGHRYSAVYPSVVDGEEYRWYLGENEIEIPIIGDLPWLPEAWQDYLQPTPARRAAHKADISDFKAALTWLRDRCLPGEAESVEIDPNARHDTMHKAVNQIVCNAVFNGHSGVEESLKSLGKQFRQATEGENRDYEFKQSVIGAVAYAKGQIDNDDEPDTNWNDLVTRLGNLDDLAMDLSSVLSATKNAEPETDAETTEPQPTAHGLIDLTAILSGNYQPLRPTVGQLTDGTHLLYPGEIHDIHGYSGSGKSWVGLALVAQEIEAGNGVLWVDYEQSPAIVVNRLKELGLTAEQIQGQFGYMRPEEFPFPGSMAEKEFRAVLEDNLFSLVVLDGVNQSFSLAGFDTHSTDDANQWHRLLPLKAAKNGAAVVQIDHTVKSREGDVSHAFGAQGKRANVAVSIGAVQTNAALRPGHTGKLDLVIYKDRHGGLQGRSEPYKNGYRVATFVLNADNGFIFEPVTPRSYEAFNQEPGVLDGHTDLAATDPRHMATIGTLNTAIATLLCKRDNVDSLTPNAIQVGWQELAPLRWNEDKAKIKKTLTKTRHTGLADVSTRADRLRLRPLNKTDSGVSLESLEAAETLAGYVQDLTH